MAETPSDGSDLARDGWRRRYPDPALANPDMPGLRAHCHPPNRLHGWVFVQQTVWVDIWGNEIAIGSMSGEYVRNVLAFARGQAGRIQEIVAPDLALDRLAAALFDEAASSPHLGSDASTADDLAASAWLDQTPLMQALNRLVESADTAAADEGTPA